jgi:hypothetical protein
MTGTSPESRPNWQTGDDEAAAEELLLQKIADALREGMSERKAAKLLGVSRMMFWRAKAYMAMPPGCLSVWRRRELVPGR